MTLEKYADMQYGKIVIRTGAASHSTCMWCLHVLQLAEICQLNTPYVMQLDDRAHAWLTQVITLHPF